MKNHVYQARIVRDIRRFYGSLLTDLSHFDSIASHLTAIVTKMWDGWQNQIPCVYHEMNNYHPDLLGKPVEEIKSLNLTIEDCQKCIVAQYGYSSWINLLELGYHAYFTSFEYCVNALLEGDQETLVRYLDIDATLASRHSQYGHNATLLHYAVANGVEMWRQQTPYNLPELVKTVIDYGGDVNARMMVYGGAFTPIELLDSSAHPHKAGIAEELESVLVGCI